ncbi:hypothetical protein J5N97_024378 [Dioscorea zingiberensis]|uniref:non-specific serine/threonine protein kinase n=1 Tax=Dioscorea zingiberensis TaxID=325984 RepID=A0A9D5C6M0_9LILI|nr:hypothetical protein J5N97_024378 [Dioscorea zingiberensis]
MELDWVKRVNIIRDIAQALSYLHHDCAPPIVHRDITSNNILLDEEYKACVSDFGISRLLEPNSSHWSMLAGTCGYMAPAFVKYRWALTGLSLTSSVEKIIFTSEDEEEVAISDTLEVEDSFEVAMLTGIVFLMNIVYSHVKVLIVSVQTSIGGAIDHEE